MTAAEKRFLDQMLMDGCSRAELFAAIEAMFEARVKDKCLAPMCPNGHIAFMPCPICAENARAIANANKGHGNW